MQNSAKSKPLLFDKSSIITFDEMREMLGCSAQALYSRVHRKQIPSKKLFGKLVFVQKEIDRWLVKKGLASDVQRQG